MLYKQIETEILEGEGWALRRQKGIPNNRQLWVLACMDERLPVERALGIREGDAHVFRNAGGLVTDDAIRSAMLTTNFFGTKEIIVLNHTECGMLTATGEYLTEELRKRGMNPKNAQIDPSLPGLKLGKVAFSEWIRMFSDVDETCQKQVELLRNCSLIPKDIVINGYVYETETGRLRKPYQRISEKVNTAKSMGAKGY